MTAIAIPTSLTRARALVEPELRRAIATLPAEMRAPAEYHFGWTDPAGAPVPNQGWERLTPLTPTPADRKRLGLKSGVSTFFLERLGCRDGAPVEWRTTTIRGDRYRFVADWSATGRSQLRPAAV